SRQEAIFVQNFAFNQRNELYLNQGNNVFTEVSDSAGIQKLQNVPTGDATVSWQVTLVDYDQDGDLDLIHADDQAALLPSAFAGYDRGIIQIFKNDGTGHFTNVSEASGLAHQSASWMGFSYGDINCDGHLDFFATSVGDYIVPQQGGSVPLGVQSSQWFYGSASGVIQPAAYPTQPIPGIVSTPHGWGTGMFDYDNDGDVDILFTGGMDAGPFVQVDNPGVVLKNDSCSGQFTFDAGAFASSRSEIIRSEINSMAMGDLNDDGFADAVHVAGASIPTTIPLVKFNQKWGGPFDDHAYFAATFFPLGPEEYEWAGKSLEDGRMGVQINSASNGNKWVKLTTRGSVGTLPGGKVNRDGIGATLKFTPVGGKTSMSPVLGGSSHAGQDDLTRLFGLGAATKGMVEVLWPGGARNRLYDVLAGERLTLPEIPCSYTGPWASKSAYQGCVDQSLLALYNAGVVSQSLGLRLRTSATRAYDDTH
ncbi:MAG: CRTAC1 family protein, partial [Myxococcales bacterium]